MQTIIVATIGLVSALAMAWLVLWGLGRLWSAILVSRIGGADETETSTVALPSARGRDERDGDAGDDERWDIDHHEADAHALGAPSEDQDDLRRRGGAPG